MSQRDDDDISSGGGGMAIEPPEVNLIFVEPMSLRQTQTIVVHSIEVFAAHCQMAKLVSAATAKLVYAHPWRQYIAEPSYIYIIYLLCSRARDTIAKTPNSLTKGHGKIKASLLAQTVNKLSDFI
jgi:hypothetical protein